MADQTDLNVNPYPPGITPEMVVNALSQNPIGRAVTSAYHGFMAPGQALQSTWENPVTTSQMIQPAQDMVSLLAGGGAGGAEAGAAGVFGGKLAATANKDALAEAMQMAKQRVPKITIHDRTGWFQGPIDKQWRFEINDAPSAFYPSALKQDKPALKDFGNTVGDVFYHPDLYAAYPHIKDMHIYHELPNSKNAGVYYPRGTVTDQAGNPTEGFFGLSDNLPHWDAKTTMLHELQHHLQEHEGFARGWGGPDFQGGPGYRDFDKALTDKLKQTSKDAVKLGYSPIGNDPYTNLKQYNSNQADDLASAVALRGALQRNNFVKYQNAPGEIESRAVEARAAGSATPPWRSYPKTQPLPYNPEELDMWTRNLINRLSQGNK